MTITDFDLKDDYKPWGQAVDAFERLKDEGMVGDFECYIEELYPEGCSLTTINDILAYESEEVFGYLGISDDDEDEEDDEEYRICYCPHCGEQLEIKESDIETDELGEHTSCPICKGSWDFSWSDGLLKKGDEIYTVTAQQIYTTTVEASYEDKGGKRWFIDSDGDDIDPTYIGRNIFTDYEDAEKWYKMLTTSPYRVTLDLSKIFIDGGKSHNVRIVSATEQTLDIFDGLTINRHKREHLGDTQTTYCLMHGEDLVLHPQKDGEHEEKVVILDKGVESVLLKGEFGVTFTLTIKQFNIAANEVS